MPFAAGKMGSVECRAGATFLKRRSAKLAGKAPPPYPQHQATSLHLNAGVFPQNDATFDAFFEIYLDAVENCSMLISWNVEGELEILRSLKSVPTLVTMPTLDPFESDTPWTASLAGKRVLVVTPFTDSVERQYAKRTLIWKNPDMLPEFTLTTVRAPLSAGLGVARDPDWFSAVSRLKAEMDAKPYDVALIGAGAFSLPLGAHAKKQGKVGVHLGGSTQVMFGVYGDRWVKQDSFRNRINEHWCRPGESETPGNATAIEGGCYW
ncbi:hypothetical protein AQZ50_15370 [Novosphingobium sp. Fuku2-ISO-50]|nr:hypothetical protein AQZ50_15370 [Novosphingobium sp. Fuku2-ISO-50]